VGLALGDLLHGLPINSQHEFTGNFGDLFTGFGVWSGLTLTVLSLMSGATYLTLKTTGDLHTRAQHAAEAIGVVAILVAFGFMTWIHVGLSTGFVPEPLEAFALMAVIASAWLARARSDGWAFFAAVVGIGGTVGAIFNELFPRVMISSTNSAYDLTVSNAASPPYTLKVMTAVAVFVVPAVVIYQAWTYHVFKQRLSVPRVGGDDMAAPDSTRPSPAPEPEPEPAEP
jgi:cytochrome d ubiquinol oxidase subunit II